MDKKTERGYEVRAGIFKALAHPSRLFIVEQLAAGERCVGDLAEMIGADVSTVSRHLAVLKNAGILRADKRGLQVYYRLHLPCILRFFDCVGEVMEQNAEDHRALAGGGAKA